MDMSDNLENIIRSFVGELPILIVALLGLIFTIVRWSKLGSGAMPALAGTCCVILLSLYVPFHYNVVMRSLFEDADYDQIQNLYMVSHLLISIFLAAGIGLLILGVHLGRQSNPPQ